MNGYIKIVSCNDSRKWYASLIGDIVAYDGVVMANGATEYRCRQPDGYINFVSDEDAIDMTSQLEYEYDCLGDTYGTIDYTIDDISFDDVFEDNTITTSCPDRFALEQQMMDCWDVVEDINMVNKYILDHEDFASMSAEHADGICNLLTSVSNLYNVKFQNMFSTFESLIDERKII